MDDQMSRFAAGEACEASIHRTVGFVGEMFDLVAEQYLEMYRRRSKKSPKMFGSWLDEIKRQLSIEARELWIPQPNHFVPSWLPKSSPRPFPMPHDYDEA